MYCINVQCVIAFHINNLCRTKLSSVAFSIEVQKCDQRLEVQVVLHCRGIHTPPADSQVILGFLLASKKWNPGPNLLGRHLLCPGLHLFQPGPLLPNLARTSLGIPFHASQENGYQVRKAFPSYPIIIGFKRMYSKGWKIISRVNQQGDSYSIILLPLHYNHISPDFHPFPWSLDIIMSHRFVQSINEKRSNLTKPIFQTWVLQSYLIRFSATSSKHQMMLSKTIWVILCHCNP